jgi:hypothetical protein
LIRVLLTLVLSAVVAAVIGCSTESNTAESNEPTPTYVWPTKTPTVTVKSISESTFSTGFTYGNISGNKYFLGTANVHENDMLDSAEMGLRNRDWLLASRHPRGGTVWLVVGEGGDLIGLRVDSSGKIVEPGNIYGSRRDDLVPPMMVVGVLSEENSNDRGAMRVENLNSNGRNHLVAGVQFEEFGDSTAISYKGRSTSYTLMQSPDSVPVMGNGTNLYSYSEPTDRYPHGALGDRNEWASLIAISLDGDDRTLKQYDLSDDEVFEGLYPLAADVDGDGEEEIVTTVSNSNDGARLVVFKHTSSGLELFAESAPVGTGFRWLHQIAVAPFGPNGEIEIAVVETPHVGGIAKFYRLVGGRLDLVASEAGGYMSHLNGSRNLDQAAAGDFDGDGNVELLVPSRDQETLVALRRIGDSVEEVWKLELGSRLGTNLSVVETEDGGLVLGASTENGILHIWQ